jgi:photosystem II stability/assembly factor-like uncharacterized protein
MKTRIFATLLIVFFVLAGCTPVATPTVQFPTVQPPTSTLPADTATPVPPTMVPTVAPTAAATATPEPTVETRPVSLTRIHMADAQKGYAIGGQDGRSNQFLRTTDGGKSWIDMTPVQDMLNGSNPDWDLTSGFYGAQNIWLMLTPIDLTKPDTAVVMYSTDGGSTFAFSDPLDLTGLNESFMVGTIRFVDENNGWLLAHVGAGMNHDYIAIYKTVDGGASWQKVFDPTSPNDVGIQSCSKNDMFFVDQNTGFLTGTCNGVAAGVLLFKTTDGGSTWQKEDLPEPKDKAGLFADQNVSCATDSPQLDSTGRFHLAVTCKDFTTENAQPVAYSYTSGADGSWASKSYPGGALVYLDGSKAAAASPDWYTTVDDGQTWTAGSKQPLPVLQMEQASDGTLFALAQQDTSTTLFTSTDAGQNWTALQPGVQ